jgi:hypothetical protein
MTIQVPIRRGFPRANVVVIQRRRGMGDTLDSFVDWVLWPGASQNINTGTLSNSQLGIINAANAAALKQAATNPVTGEVNQALLNQDLAAGPAETQAAANVTNISTGSWFANVNDMLQGTYTGALGLPGFTPPLGTPVPSAGPGIDWTSLLETAALYGGGGLLAYLLLKRLLK